MLNTILADFYERDFRKLIEEINLFKQEDNLWKTEGTIKNPAGNLVLHIIGGSKFLIGATLAKRGYVRNRDLEFAQKGVERKVLIAELEEVIEMVRNLLNEFSPEDMEADYPIVFDGAKRSNTYLLVQLLAHLNYHLGQVNYLRRVLELS